MAVQNKKRKKTVYHVKKGAQNAAYNFLSAFGIFMLIFAVTVFFILFQWKSVKFRSNLSEIDILTKEVLDLNASNSQLEIVKNELLKEVPYIAEKQLGMITPVQKPGTVLVNAEKLRHYETKDQTVQESGIQR